MTKFLESTACVVVLLIIIAVSLILTLGLAFRSTMDGIEWETEAYFVKSGDSLWSISERYCPDGVDCREWIDEIQELNGLDDSLIYPGQCITILTAKEV